MYLYPLKGGTGTLQLLNQSRLDGKQELILLLIQIINVGTYNHIYQSTMYLKTHPYASALLIENIYYS